MQRKRSGLVDDTLKVDSFGTLFPATLVTTHICWPAPLATL